MNRLAFLSTVHWTTGLLITIMGLMGLFHILGLGYEPYWHAIIKILVGLLIIGVGIYFTRMYISNKKE